MPSGGCTAWRRYPSSAGSIRGPTSPSPTRPGNACSGSSRNSPTLVAGHPRPPPVTAPPLAAPCFEVGRVYNRRADIHRPYGGQQQGGISTPTRVRCVFLFTGPGGAQHGYRDGWNDDGVFLYTGEG